MQVLKPEEVGGGSSGVALLRVEQEPVAVLELLLRDIPDRLFIRFLRKTHHRKNDTFVNSFFNLKIARALSSSDVQYLTSTLTRLENVWYSVLAACRKVVVKKKSQEFSLTSFAVSSTVSNTFMLFSYTSSFLCSGGAIGGGSLDKRYCSSVSRSKNGHLG